MILPFRTIAIMLILMVAMFFITLGVVTLVEQKQYSDLLKAAFEPSRVINNSNTLANYGTIESVDLGTHRITVVTYNYLVNANVRVRFIFNDTLVVERQNAIIEDGAVTHLEKRTPASLSDLQPGSRVQVLYSRGQEGVFLTNIIIGDPFPRP